MLINKNFTAQGGDDDTAMNGIILGCDTGDIVKFAGVWGSWGKKHNCPGGFTGAKFKSEDRLVSCTMFAFITQK